MTTTEHPNTQTLTDEQRQHARRIIRQIQKGSFDISTPRDAIPDVGPLREALDMLLSNYQEGGVSTIAGTIQALSADYPILVDLTKKSKYEPYKISTLLNLPNPEWILTNFLYEDALSVVYGPPGSYKSFVVLDWMCHIALGKPWQGREVKKCRVIYLAAEGIRGYRRRISAWCHHFERKPEELEAFLSFIPIAVPLHNAAEVGDFIEAIQDAKNEYDDDLQTIIVLDTLFQCAAGQNINAPETMTSLVSAAQRIKIETEATHILIVHHSGKDRERGMSGNLALKGSTDLSYMIEADKDGLITIKSDKIKDDEDLCTYVQRQRIEYGDGLRDNSCIIIATEKPEKTESYTSNQRKILDVLPSVLPGMRYSEIQSKIEQYTGTAMKDQTFKDNLKKLVDKQAIIKTRDGGYCVYTPDLARSEEDNHE